MYGAPLQSYKKAQFSADIEPKKLILILYETAIQRLNLAKDGLQKNDPKKRGENMGKALAIIAHLNASLDKNIKTDEIEFLRGLYVSMMIELTKVAVTKEVKTIDRAIGYITELKRIWVTTVMNTDESKASATQGITGKQTGGSAYPSQEPQRHHSFAV